MVTIRLMTPGCGGRTANIVAGIFGEAQAQVLQRLRAGALPGLEPGTRAPRRALRIQRRKMAREPLVPPGMGPDRDVRIAAVGKNGGGGLRINDKDGVAAERHHLAYYVVQVPL